MTGHGLAAPVMYACAILAMFLSIFWRPQIGLYFLVPLLPLQTARYKIQSYPFGEKLVLAMMLAVVLGMLRKGRFQIPATFPLKTLIILLASFSFVSLWLGSLQHGLPWPISLDDPRVGDWVNYILMAGLYVVALCSLEDMRQIKILMLLMCGGLLVIDRDFYLSMSGRDLTHFSDAIRDSGPLGWAGENGLAAFEAQISLFILGIYAYQKKLFVKLGLLALLVGNMYCLLFAFSRGGYLGFAAGLAFLGIFKDRKLLVLLLVLGLGWGSLVPGAVKERIAMTYDPAGNLESSAQTRVTLWEDASELFMSNPVIGTGYDTYQFMHRVGGYTDTHNLYMKVIVETGLLGLALFLCLLGVMFRSGFAVFRYAQDPFTASIGLGIAAMMVGVIVVNLFGDRWTYLQVNGYLWVLLGCLVRAKTIHEEQQDAEEDWRGESLLAEHSDAVRYMESA